MATFLIVDDNKTAADALRILVERRGYTAFAAYDGEQALTILERESIDILVTDVKMPRIDGMQLLKIARERWPDIVVVLITAYGSVELAVEAMKVGAFDFVTKPLDNNELQVKFQKAVAQRELAQKMERLSARVMSYEEDDAYRYGAGEIIGSSPPMRQVFEMIEKVAPSDSTVLICGESGTGKELVARAIHYKSMRANAPFISAHCVAYAEGVLESELFGHERGAFTGAAGRRIGRFELADRGTFFLDEVGDIPLGMQTKLLRVLQEKEFERVGGDKTIKVNIRIVSATNKNLPKAVKEGAFREDLYYRLNVFTIDLPPLRNRKSDIPSLIDAFVQREARRLGRSVQRPVARALDVLMDYDWPGNVRELRNVIERAAVLADGAPIDLPHLPPMFSLPVNSYVTLPDDDVDFDGEMENFERRLILHAYERSGRVKAKAARMLGIDRNRFRNKLEKFGITD